MDSSIASARPLVAVALALIGSALPTHVYAQADIQTTPGQAIPTPQPPESVASDAQAKAASPTQGLDPKWARINRLAQKGWITPSPTFDDTLLQDQGGWRSKLSDRGLGLLVYGSNLFAYDLAQAGKRYPGPQLYNGQRFTTQVANYSAILTYDLGTIGLDGGQLLVMGTWYVNGDQARNGPRGVRLREAYWYQPVLNGAVELEAGIITNFTDYVGVSVGGVVAGGALGPTASIPVQVGQSFGTFGAPTVSAKVNWSKRFYTRSAIQRSISPGGPLAENASNSSGLAFSVPGAKSLFIQEIGYRVLASPGVKTYWIRGGGFYNTSDYRKLDGSGTDHNHAFYLLADWQLTQPDQKRPGRGLYIGGSVNTAAGNVNRISRYYEARAYVKGPFAARPLDLASLVITYNGYSRDGRRAAALPGEPTFDSTRIYTGSYTYRITHGLYIQPGVAVIEHPVANRNVGTAVNGLFSIVSFL